MAILSGDVKIIASSNMLDVPEGGGAPSSVVIPDNSSNTIFNDISELDRAGGRVSIVKLFASVQTPDTETYLGSNVIIAKPPEDTNVGLSIFTTNSTFDKRADAKNRVEAYLAPGPEWAGSLFENHVTGQRAIQIFQRLETPLPEVGKTLLLVSNEGLTTEKSQYVRVTQSSSVIRTFSYTNGASVIDYKGVIVTCDLTDPLRFDFSGTVADPTFSRKTGNTILRDTNVADAASYFGCVPLSAPVTVGALAANVGTIFNQLVPSAQVETVLTDTNMTGQTTGLVEAGTSTVTYNVTSNFSATENLAVGAAITPGTLNITVGTDTYTDTGGQLFNNATVIGIVEYALGIVKFSASLGTITGNKVLTFKPAFAPLVVASTSIQQVTVLNRSYNYTKTFLTPPVRGATEVSYRSNGKWYTLRDSGNGVLKGSSSAFGTGTVSFTTGNVSITLGALPDVGTAILYSFGKTVEYNVRSSNVVAPGKFVRQLPHTNVLPSTFVLTWSTFTATDDGAGNLTGDATGTISYTTGIVEFSVTPLPATNFVFTSAYSFGPPGNTLTQTDVNPTIGVGIGKPVTLALGANIRPGTLSIKYPVFFQTSYSGGGSQVFGGKLLEVTVRDNKVGAIVLDGTTIGTVNYVSGATTFATEVVKMVATPTFAYELAYGSQVVSGIYAPLTQTGSTSASQAGAVTLVPGLKTFVSKWNSGGTSTPITNTFSPTVLKYNLTNGELASAVRGSVQFAIAGDKYFDTAGVMYKNVDPATGIGTNAGTINYASGDVSLTSWPVGFPNTLSLTSLSTSGNGATTDNVAFRIPVAPVRATSFQLLGNRPDGTQFTATSNALGVINGTDCEGEIDYQTGVVIVRFGKYVTASTVTSEPWYSALRVNGNGTIWRPMQVLPESLKYNAVAFSYLPLDANILGIDPVRLPQDGKVPIFKPGYFGVLGNTQLTAATTVINGQTINVGRTRLSRARVIGNNGNEIFTGYSVDLNLGTVLFSNVSGYSQPVKVEHRIEDMAQINDVQISGVITFTRQITHDYPLAGSYLSSALVAGDLKARVSTVFDQATWNGTDWKDTVDGLPSVGTYNITANPIVVTNAGAITERWALQFTSSTAFRIIGEHVGVIGVGSINSICSPINPATNLPYFIIAVAGWGTGWSVGEILRINTIGTEFPYYIVRTVQQGPEAAQDYSFTQIVRGNVDQP
jgi:hypothetical protein